MHLKRNNNRTPLAAIALPFLLALCFAPVAGAQPSCGGEGQSVCTIGAPEFYVNNNGAGCQYDLQADGNTAQSIVGDDNCVNLTRHTHVAQSDGWVRWAMAEQRKAGSNAQLNWITTMGTHNSYSNGNQGYNSVVGQNQILSISDQLDNGARVLEIDPHAYLWDATGHLTVCHGSPILGATDTIGCAVTSGNYARYLSAVFQEIRNWLNRNPGEVLSIFIDAGGPGYNTLDGHQSDFAADVFNGFGSLIWTTNDTQNNGGHIPTIQQILNANRQVFLFSNYDEGTTYVHALSYDGSAGGKYPTNSDDTVNTSITNNSLSQIYSCQDSKNNDWLARSRDSWFRISEGRSGSDYMDAVESGGLSKPAWLPLVDEAEVAGGNLCAASYIELDYLFNRSAPSIPHYQNSGNDNRYRSSVWSWADGDYGRSGPAALSMANDSTLGRWVSTSPESSPGQAQLFYAACTVDKPPYWGHQIWILTNTAVSYQDAPAACASAGGTFAVPYNARENASIFQAAKAKGITTSVWLKYSVNNGYTPLFTTLPVVFRFTEGSQPNPQSVQILGQPGKVLSFKYNLAAFSNANVQISPPLALIDANGVATVTLTFTPATKGIIPGTPVDYGMLVASYVDDPSVQGATLVGAWTILPTTPILGTDATSTPSEAAVLHFYASLPDLSLAYNGTLTLYDKQTSPTDPTLKYLVQKDSRRVQNVTSAAFETTLSLTPGPHEFYATYTPDQTSTVSTVNLGLFTIPVVQPADLFHAPGVSGPIDLTALPHFSFSPMTFTVPAGSASSQSQSVLIFTNSATISSDSTWVTGAWSQKGKSQPQIVVSLSPNAVASLAPGTYSAKIAVLDTQAATNPGHATDYISVTLNVQTTLSASPASLNLAVGGTDDTEAFQVSAPNNAQIPISVTSDSSWLVPAAASPATPSVVWLTLHGSGLTVGVTYTGNVTIHSADAVKDLVVPVSVQRVAGTDFVSNVSGLTIVVDGGSVALPAHFSFLPGSSHVISAAPYSDNPSHPDARSTFSSWSDGGAATHSIIGGSASPITKYTLTYKDQYQLSGVSSPTGAGSLQFQPVSPDGYYDAGTQVQVTAVAAGSLYSFTGFSGASNSTSSTTSLRMDRSQSLVANFTKVGSPITATINTNQPGTKIQVNGVEYVLPAVIPMGSGDTYTLMAEPVYSPSTGVQWIFQSWSNGVAATQTLIAPNQNFTLSVTYAQQFQLTTAANPPAGGTVTGAGWYSPGSSVQVQATPNAGYTFAIFSGTLGITTGGSATSSSITLVGPMNVTANFVTGTGPVLYATTDGQRTDGPGTGQRTVPLAIVNSSLSGVGRVAVEIGTVTVLQGTGTVSPALAPVTLFDIGPNSKVDLPVIFNWPATATRISVVVKFTGNFGGYSGSTTLTIFR